MSEYRRLKITWNNRAGELDSAYAFNEKDAVSVLYLMTKDNELHDGDTFTVEDVGATGS